MGDKNGRPGSVVQQGRAALGYWQQRLCALDTHMGCSGTGQAITVHGHFTGFVVHLVVPPGSVYRLGRHVASTTAESAALLPPGLDFTRSSPAGEVLALRFEADRMQAERTARRGGGDGGLPFLVTPLPGPSRAALLTAAADLAGASGPGTDPRVVARVVGRLHALVADLLEVGQPPMRAGALSAARLADLEAWIDVHLAEPLTLGRLCEQAGVGARSLQKAFLARRGMSPMRHVAERRFAAARQRLRQATPGDTVTAVALDCGFDHMGRFAVGYRQLFGESPSQTLCSARDASFSG